MRRLARNERGDFMPATLVFIVMVIAIVGFTVDAGRLMTVRRDMNDTATQAALAGASQVDGHAVVGGDTGLHREAIAAANAYLASVGVEGSARIEGDELVVETRTDFDPVMFLGFGNRTVTGSGNTRAVLGVDGALN